MATSPFFNQDYSREKKLYDEIIMEQIRVLGRDVYYLPRKLVKEDRLFGEDILSSFNSAYIIEMYFENDSLGSGEADALSKFGLELRDEAKFKVSRRRWEQVISLDQNLIVNSRPNEGDLIFFAPQEKLYEITFVEDEENMSVHADIPVYTLSCKNFEYSNEALDTGIAEIDIIEDTHSTDLLNLYDFLLEDGTGDLLLENGDNLTQEAYKLENIDKSSINEWIQTESDKILDFTNKNPFGEP